MVSQGSKFEDMESENWIESKETEEYMVSLGYRKSKELCMYPFVVYTKGYDIHSHYQVWMNVESHRVKTLEGDDYDVLRRGSFELIIPSLEKFKIVVELTPRHFKTPDPLGHPKSS